MDKRSVRLCLGKEDVKRLLSSPERGKWRTEFLYKKWLDMNEDVACRKVRSCANKAYVRNFDISLDRVKKYMVK